MASMSQVPPELLVQIVKNLRGDHASLLAVSRASRTMRACAFQVEGFLLRVRCPVSLTSTIDPTFLSTFRSNPALAARITGITFSGIPEEERRQKFVTFGVTDPPLNAVEVRIVLKEFPSITSLVMVGVRWTTRPVSKKHLERSEICYPHDAYVPPIDTLVTQGVHISASARSSFLKFLHSFPSLRDVSLGIYGSPVPLQHLPNRVKCACFPALTLNHLPFHLAIEKASPWMPSAELIPLYSGLTTLRLMAIDRGSLLRAGALMFVSRTTLKQLQIDITNCFEGTCTYSAVYFETHTVIRQWLWARLGAPSHVYAPSIA